MLLIDKYNPKNVGESYFHEDIIKLLNCMKSDEAIPNIIFYGPVGSGKKTLIKLFMEMLFDENVHKTKNVEYKVTGSGNKTTFENVKQSDYHIVFDPKNNNSDRYMIHDIVKEYAKRPSLDVFKTSRKFKIVLMNNLDNMAYYAQTSLRRTMEIYNVNVRFIMWCESLYNIIEPLRSRCFCLRVPAPPDGQMFEYLFKISLKENIFIPEKEFANIIVKAKGNIKDGLWALEYSRHSCEFTTDYYKSLNKILDLVIERRLSDVMIIRNIISSLMITNFDKTVIMRDIINTMCESKKISDKAKQKIVFESAKLQHQLVKGRREIIQFDALITFMMKTISEDKMPKTIKSKEI
jgi:replication factor C subunit 3/5